MLIEKKIESKRKKENSDKKKEKICEIKIEKLPRSILH